MTTIRCLAWLPLFLLLIFTCTESSLGQDFALVDQLVDNGIAEQDAWLCRLRWPP